MMEKYTFKEESLKYHFEGKPGKLEIRATTPLETQHDLSMAYSPGVAHACEYILEDPLNASQVTARGNLVGVISNGTAVLGLGAIGALASKPVMEGKAVLMKKFADIDVFDIEIDETDQYKLTDVITTLEPTFGGIILEDIKAPECFYVEKTLRERMSIPVFHDDQHGTAVVSTAAVIAWLRITGKKMEEVKLVISGAGSASMSCTDLIVSLGLKKENVLMCDSRGLIYEGREAGMNEYKARYARKTDMRTLEEAMDGADILFGLSQANCVTADMVKKMAPNPLILAMANPDPEIRPEIAREARPDAIIGTGRSDYPNQVNNVLCFPFLFRGALDCGATTINEEMKLACAYALVDLALQESTAEVAKAYGGQVLKFGPEYIIPKPFDPRLIEIIPAAVVKAAMETGVASRPIADLEAYKRQLSKNVVRSGMFMQPVINTARGSKARLVYADGENEDILHAAQSVIDESIAAPILVGRPQEIQQTIDKLGLRLEPGNNVEIISPRDYPNYDNYTHSYHQIAGRAGASIKSCEFLLRTDSMAIATMALERGDADGMICGKVGRFDEHLKQLLQIIGLDSSHRRASTLTTLLMDDGPLFLTDCFIDIEPSVEDIVSKTLLAIEMVRQFGITPKVALLSHSNFGSSTAPTAVKMRKAAALLRNQLPDVEIDGEMHSMSALNDEYRNTIYQNSKLTGNANLLVFPSLDSANIALGLLRQKANGLLVGPYLSGLSKPAHIMVNSATPRAIYNMSALAVADILSRQSG
jgi:malate dehydrogenase (oxaloacetate-decarboxylating)(NADP+)